MHVHANAATSESVLLRAGAASDGVADWLRERPNALVVIDFDAGLAPALSRDGAPRFPPALLRDLRALAGDPSGPPALVSGRRLERLRPLLPSVRAHVVGEHGWEWCDAAGRKVVHQLPGRADLRLGRAMRAAEACDWRPHLERRRCSVRLATSRLAPERAQLLAGLCRELWSDYEGDGLRVVEDAGGVELRAIERTGIGSALEIASPARSPVPVLELTVNASAVRRPESRHPDRLEAVFDSAGALIEWLRGWVRRHEPARR